MVNLKVEVVKCTIRIIMETDEENIRNGANTAIPAIVVGVIVIAVILYFTVL